MQGDCTTMWIPAAPKGSIRVCLLVDTPLQSSTESNSSRPPFRMHATLYNSGDESQATSLRAPLKRCLKTLHQFFSITLVEVARIKTDFDLDCPSNPVRGALND